MKIVILDGYTLNPGDLSWEAIETLGELTVYDRTDIHDENVIAERIGDAQVVYTNKTPISEETMNRCKNIRFIGVLATGYNIVDTAAASERGISVCNIPNYGTDAVAQFAIGLLLELCHHIGAHDEAVKRGDWTNNKDWCFWNYPLIELAGKVMGVIGFGRIGRRTAEIAQALGMKVLACDVNRTAQAGDACRYAELPELLEQSDVIVLHCPLLEDTAGIINRHTIAKMKDGVLIINNSRGPLINEEDLRDALNSGKVGGAACDVVSEEPIRGDNPLLQARNMILTPHISWASKESRMRLMDIAAANLQAFLSDRPRNIVNR